MTTSTARTPWILCDSPLNEQGMYANDGSAALMLLLPDGERKRIGSIDCQTPFKRGQGHAAKCAERDAWLAFIVRAANSHEELVAALEAMLGLVGNMAHADSIGSWSEVIVARAALAKARQP